MSKHKNLFDKTTDNLAQAGQGVGVMLMAAAAVSGMLELPNHENNKIIVPVTPVFAFAGEANDEQATTPIRREKETEETSSYHVSYSVNQRTPARSGKP